MIHLQSQQYKELDDGWLYKYEASTGRFGLLSKDGTISTFFVPSVEYGGLTPEEYWKKILKEHNWKRVRKDG